MADVAGGPNPSLIALASLLTGPTAYGVVILIGKAWVWYFGRKDQNRDAAATRGMTHEEKLQAQAFAGGEQAMQAAKMLADQAVVQAARADAERERADREIDEKDREIAALKLDRDRGWNLARFWFAEFLQVLHWMRSARAAAEGMWNRLKTAGKAREEAAPLWQPDRPSATMSLEDPIQPKAP